MENSSRNVVIEKIAAELNQTYPANYSFQPVHGRIIVSHGKRELFGLNEKEALHLLAELQRYRVLNGLQR